METVRNPEGMGSIGELLARSRHATSSPYAVNGSSFHHADGNGNVTYLAGSNGGTDAAYRDDPFGRWLAQTGSYAAANVMRFSGKPWVAHNGSNSDGLYYYGYRFYDPNLQRWLSRDPIGERGGINLYGYVDNDPVNYVDPFGWLKYRYDGVFLYIYPSWWQFWKSEPEVYWGTPELYQRVLRDKDIEDAAVNAAAALALLELQKKLLDDQQKRQTPPANCPKPPGWNKDWQWQPPTGDKDGNWRWFDPNGGEWRRHEPDKWHPDPHWDYNPWDKWNSPWRNIDEKGNPIPKTPAPRPPKAN
jgi:RHS repeat-associated protein